MAQHVIQIFKFCRQSVELLAAMPWPMDRGYFVDLFMLTFRGVALGLIS